MCYLSHKTESTEMDGACGVYGGKQECLQ